MCVYVCLWANSFRGLWAQLHVCIKESSCWENANSWWNLPQVQQGQAVSSKRHFCLCCCPFLGKEENSLHWKCTLHCSRRPVACKVGCKGFLISAESQTATKTVNYRARWTRQKHENRTGICLLSLFHSQTYLLISSSVSPPHSDFYCLLRTTTTNFA